MMDRINELENRLNSLVAGKDDLEPIGYDELHNLWSQIDELKIEANQIAENMLVGVTREPNGRYKGRNNIEFDIHDIAVVSAAVDAFTDRCYARISELNREERYKKDQYMQRGKRIFELNNLRRANNSMIDMLKGQITNYRRELGDPGLTEEMIADLAARGITYTPNPSSLSPERRYYLEQQLAAARASLEHFEAANLAYDEEERKLREEMDILKNGGLLPDREAELTPEPEREGPEMNPVPGVDEPTEEELPPELDPEEDEEAHAIPVPVPVPTPGVDETTEEELPPELDPEEDEEAHAIPVPVPVPTPGVDETTEEELPPELDPEEDEEEHTTPDPTPGDDEEEPEEEEEVVAVVAPKETLWKKIGKAVLVAVSFLSVVGTAVHTGLMTRNLDALVEQNEDEDLEEDKTQDKDPEEDKDKSDTQDSTPKNDTEDKKDDQQQNTPSETPKQDDEQKKDDQQQDTPSETPKQDEEEKKDDQKEDKPIEQPDENPGDDQDDKDDKEDKEDKEDKPEERPIAEEDPTTGLPFHLEEGESAVDLVTGVEVTEDGTQYQDGQKVGEVDLAHDEEGRGVVQVEDFVVDETPEVPKTGEEITESEAEEELTQGEQENLEDAIENFDWDEFFENSGPTLTP